MHILRALGVLAVVTLRGKKRINLGQREIFDILFSDFKILIPRNCFVDGTGNVILRAPSQF